MKLHTRREARPFPAFPARRTLARLVAGALLVGAQAVHAQSLNLDLPTQSLESALANVARQSGLQLALDPALAAGRSAPALSGQFTTMQAFERLLAGSGLQAVRRGDTLVIQPVSRGDTQLPSVTVTAGVERNALTEGTGSYTTGSANAATGMNLSLKETPQSISVITRQRMDDQGLQSFGALAEQTPGLYRSIQGPDVGGMGGVSSRGGPVSSFQVDGFTTPNSAWIQDGTGNSINTAIYDSVVVVRGATGLMTGAGEPTASINFVRKRPGKDFRASIEGSVGRWDQRGTVVDVGGALNAAATVRGRFVAAYDESESWVRRYESERSIAYGILEADLSSSTLLSLSLDHSHEKSNAGLNYGGLSMLYSDGTPTPFTRRDGQFPDWGEWDAKRTNASVSLEHAFNADWSVKLNYSNIKFKTFENSAGYYGYPSPDHIFSELLLRRYRHDADTDAFSASLHGQYRLFGLSHDLTAGFSRTSETIKTPEAYWESEYDIHLPVVDGAFQYPEPDWETGYRMWGTIKNKQTAFYLATKIRLSDRLSAILGGRWNDWETYRDWVGNVIDDRKQENIFVPYAGIVFDLTQQLSAYASYTETFRPQNYRDAKGNLLDPETGKNHELGLKGEWFDGRLNASVAVFETWKDNLAVVDDWSVIGPTGSAVARAENNTEGRGWELEVAGELTPQWKVQGGYTRFRLDDSEGNRLNTSIPIHQFKLFSTYESRKISGLLVGGGLTWQSKIYGTSFDSYGLRDYATQKSYAVVNLMARYSFSENLSVSANMNNVFDKNYRGAEIFPTMAPARRVICTSH
ncbi:TonB-dependent siderophore receptor [Thauera sp. SDU_THAU2]|uniref:TonB-dependent siderophore receptor n=1 Tax=Thauera sp. SDU_THAU2 TaxID=3136633 RepID=UPI00311EDF54